MRTFFLHLDIESLTTSEAVKMISFTVGLPYLRWFLLSDNYNTLSGISPFPPVLFNWLELGLSMPVSEVFYRHLIMLSQPSSGSSD